MNEIQDIIRSSMLAHEADAPVLGDLLAGVQRRERARRRNLHVAGAVALAVVAVATLALAPSLLRTRSPQEPVGGDTPISSFALRNKAEITAAGARAYQLLVAEAGGTSAVTHGWPYFEVPPADNMSSFVSQVAYPLAGGSALLKLTVISATVTASEAPGLAHGQSPCDIARTVVEIGKDGSRHTVPAGDETDVAGCTRTPLPGGALLWTYVDRQRTSDDGTKPTVMEVAERDAMVMAPDGSAMRLQLSAVDSRDRSLIADPAVGPSVAELGELAQRTAVAWQG